MPRELSSKPCEVTFYDRLSDSNITLYYRMPTTEERIKYSNSLVQKRLNKIESTIGQARIKAGANIILGFKEGAFSLPDKGLISSEPASKNYDPQWKDFIKQYASDILETLAVHVFEAPLSSGEAKPEEDGEDNSDPS